MQCTSLVFSDEGLRIEEYCQTIFEFQFGVSILIRKSAQMRSVYALPEWLLLEFPDVPLPPFLTHSHHKALHSLPLIAFLFVACVSIVYSVCIGVWIYIIDGPIRASWGLGTALTHAMLKVILFQFCIEQPRDATILKFQNASSA